jgi:hypothetical protein
VAAVYARAVARQPRRARRNEGKAT